MSAKVEWEMYYVVHIGMTIIWDTKKTDYTQFVIDSSFIFFFTLWQLHYFAREITVSLAVGKGIVSSDRGR